MLPHPIEKIDPAQLVKAKYGFIKGVEHNGDVYIYIYTEDIESNVIIN